MLDDRLRDEILESQRVQSQLAKWKLLSIAAIVAAALGAVPGVRRVDRLGALFFVPVVCFYVDVLAFHASARILTIAQYFRVRRFRELTSIYEARNSDAAAFDDYERYLTEPGHRSYLSVEPLAMTLISVLASAAVLGVGTSSEIRLMLGSDYRSPMTPTVLTCAGTLGILLTIALYMVSRRAIASLLRDEDIVHDKAVIASRAALEALHPGSTKIFDTPASIVRIDPRDYAGEDGDPSTLDKLLNHATLIGKTLSIQRKEPASDVDR